MSQKKESQGLLDFFLPKNFSVPSRLTDDEAELLYKIWKSTPNGTNTFSLPNESDTRKVTALKTKGYIAGYGDSLEFTERGKKVIVEMVTNEPNSFDKKAVHPRYNTIKAKRGRKDQTVKKASKENHKPFNLRERSWRKISDDTYNQ